MMNKFIEKKVTIEIEEDENFPKKKKNSRNYIYKKKSFTEINITLFKKKINWSELRFWEKFLALPLFLLIFALGLVWFILLSPIILIRWLFFRKETTEIKRTKAKDGSVRTVKVIKKVC